jgi:hypothetical protein
VGVVNSGFRSREGIAMASTDECPDTVEIRTYDLTCSECGGEREGEFAAILDETVRAACFFCGASRIHAAEYVSSETFPMTTPADEAEPGEA